MAKKVLATLVIDLARSAEEIESDGRLMLEIDSREDGLNGGNTQFTHQTPVYYLMYLDNVTLDSHRTSAGVISAASPSIITFEHEEYIQFQNAREAQLQYPNTGAVQWSFEGTAFYRPGGVEGADYRTYSGGLSAATSGTSRLIASEEVLGVVRARYTVTAKAFKLSNVPSSVTRIMIWATGTSID